MKSNIKSHYALSKKRICGESSLVFAIVAGLCALKHILLQTHVFDLGLYEQWASLAGQGRWHEVGSLYQGFTRTDQLFFGDHSSVILWPIGLAYRLWPSTGLLIIIQSLGMSAGYGLLLFYASAVKLARDRFGLLRAAILLNPIFFNSALDLFSLESIAFPLIVGALVVLRFGHRISAIFLVLTALLTKELVSAWCVGLGLYLCFKARPKAGIGIASMSISIGCLSYSLNSGNHDKLGERLLTPDRLSSLSGVQDSGNIQDWLSIFSSITISTPHIIYLCLVCVPLLMFASKEMVPSIAGMAPVLAINLVSEAETMRSFIYHYQLPLLMWTIIGIIDSRAITVFGSLGLGRRWSKYLAIGILLSGFLGLSQFRDPLTSWWSRSAYVRDAMEISTTIRRIRPNKSDTIYISGQLAPKIAGLDNVYWSGISGISPTDARIVVLQKATKIDGAKEPLWRKAANKIFGYGHQSISFSEYETFFSSANRDAYDCSHLRQASMIAICTKR